MTVASETNRWNSRGLQAGVLLSVTLALLLGMAPGQHTVTKASGARNIPVEDKGYWNQFRGPHGDGKTAAKDLPVEFSETKNLRWKTPIHDQGWSSPVVWGNQIWLTTAREDGRELFAICVNLESGKIVHDIKVFDVADPQKEWPKLNTHAGCGGETRLCSLWGLRHRLPGHREWAEGLGASGPQVRSPRAGQIFADHRW